MATSPSSSSSGVAAKTDIVWLYQPVGGLTDSRGGPSLGVAGVGKARFARVAKVFVSNPHPAIVLYNGGYYAWSYNDGCYLLTTPYPAVSAAAPVNTSPLANPIF